MIRFTKKIICFISAASVISSTIIIPASSADAQVFQSKISCCNLELLPNIDSGVEKVQGPTDNGLAENAADGCVLHAWNWYYKDVKSKMADIAAAGFTSVQVSPLQPNKDSPIKDTSEWWKLYQPVDFSVGSYLGGSEDFKAMCDEAHKCGVKVIVDVVANHLANSAGRNDGKFNNAQMRNSAIPDWLKNDDQYWHLNDYGGSSDTNRHQMTNGPIGMPDLNTGNEKLQDYILKYLNDAQDLGADGFRFDAAKHIELPEDGDFGSQFWPKIVNGTKAKNANVFIYGEILNTPGPISIDKYTERIRVTNNKYGGTLRGCVTGRHADGLSNMSNNEFGSNAKTWITWVESHDTFAGEYGEHTSGFSTEDVHFCWYALAARADAVPLYFARPKVFQGSNEKGAGFAGSALGEDDGAWKDKGVAEVNKFHNYFAGTGECASSLDGNKVFAVERGSTGTSNYQGVVLVNLDRGSKDISESCHMKDGTYTDQMTGGSFTVSGGKISGKIGDSGVAVVYDAKPSTASNVSASVADGSSFSTDSLSVTLNCKNCTKATYSIDGGDKTEFKDGEKIEIGKDASVGDKITLKLSGTGAEGDADATYTYTKKDPNASNVAYLKLPSGWDKAYAYVYDKSTKGSENKAWPGVAMTEVSDGLYKYEYSDTDNGFVTPLIIFNDGGAGAANKKYPADTADKVDADGLKCDGSMICDGTSWEEYVDPNKPDKPGDKKDLAVSLSADKSDIKLKSSVKLTAKASGGSGKYTYIFKEGDNELSSGADTSYEWTPEAVGDYKVTVEVNDGTKTIESSEVKVSVTDGSGDDTKELSVSLDADNTDVKLKSSVKLTAKASGGSGKYTYTFKADGDEIYSGDKSSYEWTPEKAGDYKVTVEVNDGKTTEKSDEVKVGVSEGSTDTKALSASLSSDKSGDQAVNTKIKLTAKATGGSGKYTYTFKINDKKIDNGDSAIYTWTPTASGKYTVSVVVNDGEKTKTSTVKTFNITAESTEEPSEISIDSFKLSKTKDLKVSDTVKLTAEASGGEGDLEYYFFAKKDGSKIDISKYSSKKSVSWELPSEGTYDLYVYVKDSKGTVEEIDDPIQIKVSTKGDVETPNEGDNNNLASLLLTGIFGASLLGALRRKKNM